MYCKMVINTGDVKFIIIKQGGKQSGKKVQAKFITNFYKIEDGKEFNLNGEDKVKTYDYIKKIVGTRDVFKLCNISSNTNSESLLDMSNNDILKTFTLLLHLDRFNNLFENISIKLKDNNNTLLKENGKFEMLKDIIQTDVMMKEKEIKMIMDHIYLLEIEIEDVNYEINKFEFPLLNNKLNEFKKQIKTEIDIIPKKYRYKIIKEYSEKEYIIKVNELDKYNKLLFKLKNNFKNCKIKSIYQDKNLDEIINLKSNIQIQTIKDFKIIEDIDLDEIKLLKTKIKELDIFTSYQLLHDDSNILKNKLIASDSIDEYKNEIILFLDRIKSDKELDKIKKELISKRNRLIKLEKINIKNKENKKYNIEVRKQIRLNIKNNNLLKELDKVINKKQYELYINKIKELEKEIDILDYNKMLLSIEIKNNNKIILDKS